MRECRLNSIYPSKPDHSSRKLRNQLSNPHGISNRKNILANSNQLLPKAAGKNLFDTEFSTRDSGRINTQPFTNKNRQMSHLEVLRTQARFQLQKLTFREKLTQIQHILKVVKELCKTYGYFSVTEAMLQFSFEDAIKISVWIHPDSRSTKSLHPIHKQTEFQCQLACVAELKGIVKTLFPTIDLGDAKTFTNMIAYIDSLKNDWDFKYKRSPSILRKDSQNISEQNNGRKQNKIKKNVLGSQKTVGATEFSRYEFQERGEVNNRKRLKNNQRQNENTSTLVESAKSANTILQKFKTRITSPTVFTKSKQSEENVVPQRKKRKTSLTLETKQIPASLPQPLTPKNQNESTTDLNEDTGSKTKKTNFGAQDKANLGSNRLYMKSSITGKRQMSMSIEIQSEINNLFGCNDDMLSSFYAKNSDPQAMRNSILSKVAEQFEDIF